MSFLKKIFHFKDSKNITNSNDSVSVQTNYNSNLKKMTDIDIITDAVLAAEKIYLNRGFDVLQIQDTADELPQLQLVKNNKKTLVYIGYTRQQQHIDMIFTKDRINSFIMHAKENSCDCLITVITINDPKELKEMYFGETYSYQIEDLFFPTLH